MRLKPRLLYETISQIKKCLNGRLTLLVVLAFLFVYLFQATKKQKLSDIDVVRHFIFFYFFFPPTFLLLCFAISFFLSFFLSLFLSLFLSSFHSFPKFFAAVFCICLLDFLPSCLIIGSLTWILGLVQICSTDFVRIILFDQFCSTNSALRILLY